MGPERLFYYLTRIIHTDFANYGKSRIITMF